jgi:hypothetical protein
MPMRVQETECEQSANRHRHLRRQLQQQAIQRTRKRIEKETKSLTATGQKMEEDGIIQDNKKQQEPIANLSL